MNRSHFQEAMTQFSGGHPQEQARIFTAVPCRGPLTEYMLGICEAVYLTQDTLKE